MRWVIRPGIERCHLDHRTRDGIKLFLLPAAIERASADGKSQDLPIERDAWRRAGNHDGRMIDPQAWTVPMRLAPTRRHVVGLKCEQLERMPLRNAVTPPELAGSRCGAGLVIAVQPSHAHSRE